MDEDKKDAPETSEHTTEEPNQAPADALSMTPDELEEEEKKEGIEHHDAEIPDGQKLPPFKRLLRKVNVYMLLFLVVIVIVGAIAVVNYLNSKKAPAEPNIASQNLTTESLKQLANTDVSVGSNAQTLTIQGNAVIAGNTLARGTLNVAGNFQTGGSITGPSLTISGTSNLGTAQINSLQVAGTTAIQGSTTLRDLNVAGTSTFSGAMTASQITVSNLVLSGNAVLSIPNHIKITGPNPGRSIDNGVLGNGGSASVNGSDTSGTVNINTGNNPAPGCFTHISFAQRFTSQPRVVVTPVGQAAGQTQFYVNRDTSGFSICTANAAPANQAFAYDYFITN